MPRAMRPPRRGRSWKLTPANIWIGYFPSSGEFSRKYYRAKDITRAQTFLADDFILTSIQRWKWARLIFLRASVAKPCVFHVIHVSRPERINERTLIRNFIISPWRVGDALLDTNLNRTSEKFVFEVNRIRVITASRDCECCLRGGSIGFIVLLPNATRFTLPLSLCASINIRAWCSTRCGYVLQI